MKKIIGLMLISLASCTGSQKADQQENGTATNQEPISAVSSEVVKWKADPVTKKNVAGLAQLVNDSTWNAGRKKDFAIALRNQVDTLINQCSMQGKDHEALHGWLEKVLEDLKELNEEDDAFDESFATVKKDVASFYDLFE